jgi:hypothetical protein
MVDIECGESSTVVVADKEVDAPRRRGHRAECRAAWTELNRILDVARRERDILEHAVRTLAEQAAKADELVDEAKAAGGGDHPVTVHAKMLRLELLKVKADLERELEAWVPNCTRCGLDVHWVSGLGITPGHWAHREPAPHGEPVV